MPVLNQYRFQYWHGTDVQYRASTNGKLPAKFPFGAAPVVGRAYASTAPVQQILLRYWCGTKPVVNFHHIYGVSKVQYFDGKNYHYDTFCPKLKHRLTKIVNLGFSVYKI